MRDLDMSVRRAARGLLKVHETPYSRWLYRVDDAWPEKVMLRHLYVTN
ncbi:hypothetical protein [Micromonospora rhizosphaerae]|nr:hypothetical protein [Micromonospora rhizosphaerae]